MQIFCDLDGTLLDVSERHYAVYSELVKQYSGIPLSKHEYWDLKRNKTPWPQLLPKSGVSADVLERFLNDFIEKIESPKYLKIDTLFPGVEEMLQRLAAVHECYLVSLRRSPGNLFEQTKWLGIDRYFNQIISGHSESDGHDIKVQLIEAVRSKGKGVIIGDTEADVITGKKLGLQSIAVLTGIRNRPFLAALEPDYILTSFTEIRDIIPGL